VAPSVESFKHCKELFVVHIIVEFCGLEQARMKYNWINLLFCCDQKDSYESILNNRCNNDRYTNVKYDEIYGNISLLTSLNSMQEEWGGT